MITISKQLELIGVESLQAIQINGIATLKGEKGDPGSALTAAQIEALDGMFQIAAFNSNPESAYSAFRLAFGLDVVEVPATQITLSASVLSFASVESYTITATVEPSNSTDVVVWRSDNEAVATVDNGVVTAVADGTCTITATAGSVSAECAVTVKIEAPLETYRVTNNLTNVTNSNSDTTATGNYSATLTANDGYVMDNVTITMGGVDITDSAYSSGEGVVWIASVTGNIVIAAVASEPEYIDTFGRSGMVGYENDNGDIYYFYNRRAIISNYPSKTDTEVEVVFSNNSDGDISEKIYIAAIASDQTLNKNRWQTIQGKTAYDGTLGAGVTAKSKYTIPAGYHILVSCSDPNYANMTISVIGKMDVAELPESQYEVVTTSKGTWRTYTDDGTSGSEAGFVYNTAVTYLNTLFSEEKAIRLIVDNPTSNNALSNVMVVYLKDALTAPGYCYYSKNLVYNQGGVTPNGRGEVKLTTKAGYYLGITQSLDGLNYSIVDVE